MSIKEDEIKYPLYDRGSIKSLLDSYRLRNNGIPYILEDSGITSFKDERYNVDFYIRMYDSKTVYDFNKEEIKSVLTSVKSYIYDNNTKDIVNTLLTDKMLDKIVICSDGSHRYSRVLLQDTSFKDYTTNYNIKGYVYVEYGELFKEYPTVLIDEEGLTGDVEKKLEYIYNHFDKIFVQVPYYCLHSYCKKTTEF